MSWIYTKTTRQQQQPHLGFPWRTPSTLRLCIKSLPKLASLPMASTGPAISSVSNYSGIVRSWIYTKTKAATTTTSSWISMEDSIRSWSPGDRTPSKTSISPTKASTGQSNLEHLYIRDCEELDLYKDESGNNHHLGFPWRIPSKSPPLKIHGLPKVASLPWWLSTARNLENLKIRHCKDLDLCKDEGRQQQQQPHLGFPWRTPFEESPCVDLNLQLPWRGDLPSESRVIPRHVEHPSELPKWNYYGSSTGQAPGEDSEGDLISYSAMAISNGYFRQSHWQGPRTILLLALESSQLGRHGLHQYDNCRIQSVICDSYTPVGESIPTTKRARIAEFSGTQRISMKFHGMGLSKKTPYGRQMFNGHWVGLLEDIQVLCSFRGLFTVWHQWRGDAGPVRIPSGTKRGN
ncbi:hypothetical protein NL676_029780 [Syzygium grande]|nr:hypothetical protein NL676_029780 [Syzygium grande]